MDKKETLEMLDELVYSVNTNEDYALAQHYIFCLQKIGYDVKDQMQSLDVIKNLNLLYGNQKDYMDKFSHFVRVFHCTNIQEKGSKFIKGLIPNYLKLQ